MKRKIVFTILTLLISSACFILSACAKQLNTADVFGSEEYSYQNPVKSPLVQDGYTIDGVINESVYEQKKWFEGDLSPENRRAVYNNMDRLLSVAEARFFIDFTAKGMYLAADVKDDVIMADITCGNSYMQEAENTGIWVAGINPRNPVQVNRFEWVITANGRNRFSKGRKGYGRLDWPIPNASVATVVDAPNGKLNANGYTVEAFLPYESLWLTEPPQYMQFVFGINRLCKTDVETALEGVSRQKPRRVFEVPDEINGVLTTQPGTWLYFGRDGYAENLAGTPDAALFDSDDYWNAYDGETEEVVSYDRMVSETRNRTNYTNFNSYVAGENYDPDFDTDKEKGFALKSVLREDGVYIRADIRHNLVRDGASQWHLNNNLECHFISTEGERIQCYLAHNSTNEDGSVNAISNSFARGKITTVPAAENANYNYDSKYNLFISRDMLKYYKLVYNEGTENEYVRFSAGFRSGGDTEVKTVAVALSDIVGEDGDVNDVPKDLSLARTYLDTPLVNGKYVFSGSSHEITAETDGKLVKGNAEILLWRMQYATVSVYDAEGNALPGQYLIYYMDIPEENDSLFTVGPHTAKKPYIWYPYGNTPYKNEGAFYVNKNGIDKSVVASDAVIDGKADDDRWTDYKAYTITAAEQTNAAPSVDTSNKTERGMKVKAFSGSDGIYVFGEITHKEYSVSMPYNHWNSNLEIVIGMTPKGEIWNGKSAYIEKVPLDSVYGNRPYKLGPNIPVSAIGSVVAESGVSHVMRTELDPSIGLYRTKVEAFIPYASLKATDRGADGIVPSFAGGKDSTVKVGDDERRILDDYDLRINCMWRTINDYMYIQGGGNVTGSGTSTNAWYDPSARDSVGAGNSTYDYRIENGETEKKHKAINAFWYLGDNGVSVLPGAYEYAIDGKADDWSGYAGNTVTTADTTSGSNKKVVQRAIMTDNGLYFVLEAITDTYFKHSVDEKGTMVQLYSNLNSGGAVKHVKLAKVVAAGSVIIFSRENDTDRYLGRMKGTASASTATLRADGKYDVVIEGFISRSMLISLGYDPDEFMLGFEFSPSSDAYRESFTCTAGGVWWRNNTELVKTTPSEQGKMYVTENGLSLTNAQ